MTKLLVTGASGLLGRAVVAAFKQQAQFQVVAAAFSRANAGDYRLDLTDSKAVDACLAEVQPDMIIHCAAERRPDVSEQNPEAALNLNVQASADLAHAAQRHNVWLLYVSTDYVFDGQRGNYAESDLPNPVNFYGQSKWQGEQVVQTVSDDFAILRLPILYGQVERVDESAVLVLLNQLNHLSQQHIDNWAIRSPTSTADIAQAILQLASHKANQTPVHGIYHFSARERMTKYDMLLTLAKLVGKPSEHILPADAPNDSAKRPRDCSLLCQRLEALNIRSDVDFVQGATDALTQSSQALAAIGLQLTNAEGA
ncbi:SDR family oxidoreductase [Shewanella sp. Scap07]|uniref:dTDP-4-dehydrorhamnose reductase family protein n=1 Tax=Shewanella sp. Scap07 TaxID=2589987 RepID=UPI0015BD6717|nr:SDR family oxidoreductase [Shewanella sp. Scap07]QLE84117.1 SDR family oxidoreductase [Shewanella sp. Scap07]